MATQNSTPSEELVDSNPANLFFEATTEIDDQRIEEHKKLEDGSHRSGKISKNDHPNKISFKDALCNQPNHNKTSDGNTRPASPLGNQHKAVTTFKNGSELKINFSESIYSNW